MQSKVSWFKRGIVTQDLRNVGWIGIIYLIALLFVLPLQIIMLHQNDQLPYSYYGEAQKLFSVFPEAQILLMFTVPVILSAILFRYLHVKVPADFIHSLPVKRTALYHHHGLIGIFLLLIPVVVTAIVTAIIHAALGVADYFSVADIVKWACLTMLMNVFVFVFATLIGMVTGISAVQVVLTYIFLIFPAGIMILFYTNVRYLIYGFAYDYYFDKNLAYLTPIARMAEIGHWKILTSEVLIYLALMIVFYLLGMLVYKKRQIEGATQAIAFRNLKPIFKYGVTFCTMLLGGSYFGETQQDAFGWVLFGYLFGSILGYVIAEMVLQKTWRVFRSMKGYVVYGAVIVVIGFLLNLDMIGYEKKLPIAADVERAYFSDSVHWFNEDQIEEMELTANFEEINVFSSHYRVKALNDADRYFFDENQNIESIIKLHQQLIKDKDVNPNKQRYYKRLVIAYELKNGSSLVRQYLVSEDAYHDLLKPIYESEESRVSNNDLLLLKEEIGIDKVTISSRLKSAEFIDPGQIAEMVAALKTDMLQEPYEEMFNSRQTWGEIELLLKNNQRLHLSWKRSYGQFGEWLQKNNQLERVRTMPDDILFAAIIKNNSPHEAPIKSHEELLGLFKNNEAMQVIEEPIQLEQCLYETTWNLESDYLVAIYYKAGGDPEIHGLLAPPPFVEEHFE